MIITERLAVKKMTASDISDLASLFLDEKVSETYMLPEFDGRKDAETLAEKIISVSANRIVFGIYKDNRLIGIINDVGIYGAKIELGWALKSEYSANGYMTEAVRAVIGYLFANGFDVVTAAAFEENTASMRVMEKSGMARTAETESAVYRGKEHKCVKYSKSKNPTVREKMLSGELYLPSDDTLVTEQNACLEKLYDYNMTRPCEAAKREEMLAGMFAKIGAGCYIEPPFHANWGGKHVHFGKNVYANFNLTLVDDADIYVGDFTMFGPNVTVATAGHPILPALREKVYQYNSPVHIGRNCWIGAGTVIVPGVCIGDNTVIGAGSVVTKSIPANVIAFGNPCRVHREIGEHDREYYFKDKRIPEKIISDLQKQSLTNEKNKV